MQKSTPIGLVTGFSLIFGAIFLGDGWITFFDIPALLLVLGGTGSALVVNYSFDDLQRLPEGLQRFFSFEPPVLRTYLNQFEELSRVARREGLLALDRKLHEVEDDLMRFGMELAVDGTAADEINDMLDKRIEREMRRRRLLSKVCTTAGTFAPAFGMIGTLIGLIQMMQNLDDPTQIGAGMATAMVTTFYGALLANLVFLPMASKAKKQARQTLQAREIVRYGILSIVQGDSPRMVRQRLNLFVQGDPEAAAEPTPSAEPQEESTPKPSPSVSKAA